MAHNLATLNGVVQYIGRQDAWHELGNVTGKWLTKEEIKEAGVLNFGVTKEQLLAPDGITPVNAYGTFRCDDGGKVFLGTVGADYTVIHHDLGLEMVDALIGAADGTAHYETAGALLDGSVVWALADLGLSISVGDDKSMSYLLFHTSYNGTYSHSYRLTNVRVVCNNTLDSAIGSKTKASLTFKHTKNAERRIIDAHKTLRNLSEDVKSVEVKLNILAQKRLTKDSMTTILDRLFPKTKTTEGEADKSSTRRENILADVLAVYESNDNDAFPQQRGTAYNLLNAITGYVDHARSTHGGDNGRLVSATFGSGAKLKDRAFEILLEEAPSLPDADIEKRSYSWSTRELPDNRPIMPVGGGSLLDTIIAGN